MKVRTVDGRQFRALVINGRAWFPINDLAALLQVPASKIVPTKAHRIERMVSTGEGVETLTFVAELVLYRLAFEAGPAGQRLANLVFDEVVPALVSPVQMAIEKAQALGHQFDFTKVQWEWLAARPGHLEVLPLTLAGYNSREVADVLGELRITVQKRLEKLRELGFIASVQVPGSRSRVAALETEIRLQQAGSAA